MKNWMGRLKRSKKAKTVLLIAVLCVFVINGVVLASADFAQEAIESIGESIMSVFDGGKTEAQKADEKYLKEQEKAAKQEEKAAMDGIAIDGAVKEKLNQGKKIENGYRKVMAQKAVPATQKAKLDQYLINGYDPEPVLILFDYLHDNFFTFADLDQALARYGNGEKIEDILQSYIDIQDQIQPRDYPHEEIERLVTTPGLSIEDIMIAEILDAHGSAPFYDVIDARIAGEDWETLAARYNLMNGSAKVQSITVAVNEVEACQEATGLSKEQTYKKVVEAKKAGVESEQIADFAKSGKSMGVAMKEKAEKKLLDK